MLYILTSKSELRFSNIWRGHLSVVQEALKKNESFFANIDCSTAINKTFKPNDVIINIGNHQYLGSKMLNALAAKISIVERTVFFMDDYQAPPATQLRKALTGNNLLLTNVYEPIERKSLAMFEKVYINLNKASFNLLPLKLESPKFPSSFIYWGIYRSGRDDLFGRYFRPELYTTFLSASDRGHNKFMDACLRYTPLNKLQLPEDLQEYGFTIYLRDTKQPKMCPANRFYEAVSAGLPIFFDFNSVPRVETPDNIESYIVTCAEDINIDREYLEIAQEEQRFIWGLRDYRQELIDEMAKLFYKYGIL